MKRMICDSMLVLGALAFVVTLGAAVEGTMPLAAGAMRLIARLEQPHAVCRVRRGRGRYRRPAARRPQKAEALRAA